MTTIEQMKLLIRACDSVKDKLIEEFESNKKYAEDTESWDIVQEAWYELEEGIAYMRSALEYLKDLK